MSTPEYVDPASCPSYKTYTGLVKTSSGFHKRVLQRRSDLPARPWLYFPSPEEGGPKTATDHELSHLEEVDPFVNDHLRDTQKALDQARDELDQAERVIQTLKRGMNAVVVPDPLTEERVRQIAREEINRTSWQLHGLNITHKEQQ